MDKSFAFIHNVKVEKREIVTMKKKILFYVLAAIAAILGGVSFFLNEENSGLKIGFEIASLATITFDVAFSFTINFNMSKNITKNLDLNIHNTVNEELTTMNVEMEQKIEAHFNEFKTEINDYRTKVDILQSHYSTVINNYNVISHKPNVDKNAIEALSRAFKPLEDFAPELDCESAFPSELFIEFLKFAKDMSNTNYYFVNKELNSLFIDLCVASKKLQDSISCCVTPNSDSITNTTTYAKYKRALKNKAQWSTREKVDSALKDFMSFHKNYFDAIEKFKNIIVAWKGLDS